MKNIEKEIKENWFREHIAEYKELNDGINILDWKEPGTNMYRLRYVMDNSYLYVSGDLNSAVYDLTWLATLESFADINLGYFAGKLAAYQGNKIDFDSEKAFKRIQEEIEELEYEYGVGKIEGEYFDALQKLKEIATGMNSREQWKFEIITSGLYDKLTEYDVDAWEWIFDVGDELPGSIRAHFIGLQMAAEQLGGKDGPKRKTNGRSSAAK